MSTAQAITPELKQWIIEQAKAGCQPEAVLQAMRASGWAENVAVEALELTSASSWPNARSRQRCHRR